LRLTPHDNVERFSDSVADAPRKMLYAATCIEARERVILYATPGFRANRVELPPARFASGIRISRMLVRVYFTPHAGEESKLLSCDHQPFRHAMSGSMGGVLPALISARMKSACTPCT